MQQLLNYWLDILHNAIAQTAAAKPRWTSSNKTYAAAAKHMLAAAGFTFLYLLQLQPLFCCISPNQHIVAAHTPKCDATIRSSPSRV
jgi:hypothetical protein